MGWKQITSEAEVGKILSTMTMVADSSKIQINGTKVSQESEDSLLFMRDVSYLPLEISFVCYSIFTTYNFIAVTFYSHAS